MKKAIIAAVVVLFLAVVVETFFLFQQYGSLQLLTGQLSGLQQKSFDLEKEKTALTSDKAALRYENRNLETNISKLNDEKNSLSEKVIKLEGEAIDLSGKVNELTKKLAGKTTSVSKLQSENTALNKKFMCSNTLKNVEFSSNESVSQALTEHVKRTKKLDVPVSAHYWNIIWTRYKYSTHTIEAYSEKERMVYLWKYTVYFRGENDGSHKNGIFYNDDQCWLYLDK